MSDAQPTAQPGRWRPRANPWVIAVTVTLAAFMEVLDTTIVNVALPHIAGTVSSSYDEATWILTSYLVANGIVLPISAFLARRFGRKRYFLVCIGAFTVCSFLCGIATSLWQLIVFRVLQGFFGGGLQPSQQSIILDTFQPSERGKAFAVTAIATVVAPVLGPTLGGWITDNFTWRWVFLINVPVGVLTVIAVMQWVEDPPWEKATARVSTDFIGIGLIALGLGCLQVMLDRGEDDDWFSSPFIRTFAVLAALGIVGAVLWLLYAKKPVLDLRCLADRNFALGCATIGTFAMILYASAVLIPQLAQQHLGYTATLSGLVLSPGAICIVLLIPLIQRVMPYVQTRYILTAGFFLLGVALMYSHTLVPDIDFKTLVLMRSAQSIAIGFLFVPASTLTYLTLPRYLNGDGAALFTMFRNVAGSIGISLSTALITTRTQVHMAYLSEHLTPLSSAYNNTLSSIAAAVRDIGQTVGDPIQTAMGTIYQSLLTQAAILAYLDVFAACALFAWAFIPFTFLFSPVKAAGGPGAH
ncbi:MAG: DHA2 family efflux MFS transporter permease subunit [Burkholderiaceae bacterium]